MTLQEAELKPIDELVQVMIERAASDLHLKAGSPPCIRVDGELCLLDGPALTPEDTKEYAAAIMSDRQIRRFAEQSEIDFAFSAGSGRGRFRECTGSVAASASPCAAATEIPSFEGCLRRSRQLPWPRGRSWSWYDRRGIHHPGGDDQPDQHQPATPRDHGRGPDQYCTVTASGIDRGDRPDTESYATALSMLRRTLT